MERDTIPLSHSGTQYATHESGSRFPFVLDGRVENTVIYAKKASTHRYAERPFTIDGKATKTPLALPTQKEKTGDNTHDQEEYMWVGLAPKQGERYNSAEKVKASIQAQKDAHKENIRLYRALNDRPQEQKKVFPNKPIPLNEFKAFASIPEDPDALKVVARRPLSTAIRSADGAPFFRWRYHVLGTDDNNPLRSTRVFRTADIFWLSEYTPGPTARKWSQASRLAERAELLWAQAERADLLQVKANEVWPVSATVEDEEPYKAGVEKDVSDDGALESEINVEEPAGEESAENEAVFRRDTNEQHQYITALLAGELAWINFVEAHEQFSHEVNSNWPNLHYSTEDATSFLASWRAMGKEDRTIVFLELFQVLRYHKKQTTGNTNLAEFSLTNIIRFVRELDDSR